MIRREKSDGAFVLITQHDHALLSRRLAERLDARVIAPPAPYEPVMTGIALHDCGWPLHDERPTLNLKGLPLDVFETPRAIGLEVWGESVDRAAEAHPYAGLLVSLHILSLSRLLEKTITSARDRFEINKFHHLQIERQEMLRGTIGLRTDLPLHCGLARKRAAPAEDVLRFHFRLLQAMDRISLALCCTHKPFDPFAMISFFPAGDERRVELRQDDDGALILNPWIFDADELHEQVPCRHLPGGAFAAVDEFRALFDAADVQTLSLTLRRSL